MRFDNPMRVYRTNITQSRAGHYTVTVRLNGRVVYREALLSCLAAAQSIGKQFIADHKGKV